MKNTTTTRIVTIAMLSALSVLLMMFIRFPIIPAAAFLEYEPGDVPALIAAFFCGPGGGFMVTLIVSLIQATSVSAGSGWIGGLMHLIATGSMVIVAGNIYKRHKSFKGALWGLALGSLCMIALMVPLNLFFTTRFLNVPLEAVKAMIYPIIIPFNLIKSVANSTLTVLVYKPIGRVLRYRFPQEDTPK